MTWYPIFQRTLGGEYLDTNGSTVRQLIPATSFNVGAPSVGTKIRVTFESSDVNALNLGKVSVGHRAASGDLADMDSGKVQLPFSAGRSATIPISSTLLSDEPTFAFDKTKDLIVSAYTTFPANWGSSVDTDTRFWLISGDFADTADITPAGGETFKCLISKVEVWRDDPAGNPTCTINKRSTQSDPTSGGSIAFDVVFSKGVTGFTAADIDVLSDSTAGGSLVAAITDGLDGGLGYTIAVTGMLTAGNVVAKIPSSVCTAIADGLPNDASTSTDNSVTWDPNIVNPNAPNVYEVCTIDRNLLRIEIRDTPVTLGYTQTLTTPDSGAGTYPVTNAVDNGHGMIRLTTNFGSSILISGWASYYILTMVNNGSGLIRCTMYDTSLLGGTGSYISIRHALGTIEANNSWRIQVINSTTFDLSWVWGSDIPGPAVPSAFVNTYLGGGVIQNPNQGGQYRVGIYGIVGTTEANSAWCVSRSGVNTIDLLDSHFANTYVSGGTINDPNVFIQRPNPSRGDAPDDCVPVSRFGTSLRFKDIRAEVGQLLERADIKVAANYSLSGGLSITNVYRKHKPYNIAYGNYGGGGFVGSPSFRHYIYLELSGNLTASTRTLIFPASTGLPPKTFTFNDKVTRCAAIHVDQAGHRPGDGGKQGYLSEWVPDHGSHGEWTFSSITNWHVIDEEGDIVWSAGAAPVFRIGPVGPEGASLDNGGLIPPFNPLLVRDEGSHLKVLNITKANPGRVEVDDGTRLTNGELIAFSGLTHWSEVGGGGSVGMKEVESDYQGNPFYYRVANKSGNFFDLAVPGGGLTGNPNTTSFQTFATGVLGPGGTVAGNFLYKVNEAGNRGSTNIYGLDYSAAPLVSGHSYRLYIPNIGVSDPIPISESRWNTISEVYLKALYAERQGCALDGRFGFTRDVGFKSRPGFRIYDSLMPYGMSDYSLYQVPNRLPDINTPPGGGGGYSPWITTNESTAFGSHVDAGDWDTRISETGWYYWQILDTWERLPPTAKASVSNQGPTPTLLECGLDPTLFAGTDDMPKPVAEVIWGLDAYRQSQKAYGGVMGGQNYGEGVPGAEISSTTTCAVYSWYPDHFCTLQYVFPAAKLAKILYSLGYTTLADTYKASAIAAYNWSVSLEGSLTAARAHYEATRVAAKITLAQLDANITSMNNFLQASKAAAAASLFSLTGSSTYKTVCDAFYGGITFGQVAPEMVYGGWEYVSNPTATGAVNTQFRTAVKENIEIILLPYVETDDVTYANVGAAGRYLMNFGSANNFQFAHIHVMGHYIYTEAGGTTNLTNAARCRAALVKWNGHRHGANQIGLCMTRGLGVRNNLETLHSDSVNTTQQVPIGMCSEGWCNLFPGLSTSLGTSFINPVQHPYHDPAMTNSDATLPYHELYPHDQLAWPRWEYFLEIHGAIEHSEFTTQQQLLPAYGETLFLHGWDGNAAIEEPTEPPVEPGEPRFNPGLALRMRLRNSLLVMVLAGGATVGTPTNLVSALMASPSHTTFILNDGFYTGGAINSTVLAGRTHLTIRGASRWGAKLGGIGLEAPNITLDGVEVTHPGTPVNITATGARVLNCRVHNFAHTEFGIGIWAHKSALISTKRVIIRGNTVTNWGDETFAGGIAIGEAADVQNITAVVAEITDNTITDGPTAPGLLSGGIQSFHPCIVSGNFIHTVSGQGIQIKTINSTIYRNECVNVLFDGALYNRFPPEGNNLWYGNLVHDCDVGIDHFMGSNVSYTGNVIYNVQHFGRIKNQGDSDQVFIGSNTFWNSTGSSGGWIWDLTDPGTPVMDIVFSNNIWDTAAGPAIQAAPTVTWAELGSIFWNTTAPSPLGVGSSVANPLLTSPPTNFTPTAPAAAGKGATWPIP